MFRGLSLATKSMLLFGGAVVLIVLAALFVPWVRMVMLIDEGQRAVCQQMVADWTQAGADAALAQSNAAPLGPPTPWILPTLPTATAQHEQRASVRARRLTLDQARKDADPFVRSAIDYFTKHPDRADLLRPTSQGFSREYRYAQAVVEPGASAGTPRLLGIVELSSRSIPAARMIILNTSFLLAAGALVLAAALAALWIILHKIMLAPVHNLKEVARRVREGNLAIRSDVRTGDEFEELADTLNTVLADLQHQQDRLRATNTALNMKVDELAQSNTTLHASAKMKGEFLASVSHELRTPLNSIIGFAELVKDQTAKELSEGDAPPATLKRARYLDNILTAGRGLLALINSLLEMARIEAGKIDLRVEAMNVRDACEGLLGLISPLADRKGIALTLEVADDVPNIRTDQRKFQQIIFNFLSNAVKFTQPQEQTGRTPAITLRAERLPASSQESIDKVRVSVIDNGLGISREEQELIFEKFYQTKGGHTREQTGTGLGLAIAKELANILHSEIQVVSDVGRGSMFSLIMPTSLEPADAQAGALEAKFRGTLGSGRAWEAGGAGPTSDLQTPARVG